MPKLLHRFIEVIKTKFEKSQIPWTLRQPQSYKNEKIYSFRLYTFRLEKLRKKYQTAAENYASMIE